MHDYSDVEKSLFIMANKLNDTLPMKINKYVRLDTSFAGPGLKFTYVATALTYEDGTALKASDLNLEKLAVGLCNDQNRRIHLLNGVVFTYMYRNIDLKPLVYRNIQAKDCGLSAYR